MSRDELFKQASDATILVVAAEERVYTNWKEVGCKWRLVYKDRESMETDVEKLQLVILGGFSEVQINIFNETSGLRKTPPKTLSMSNNKKRESGLVIQRRILYYYNKTLSATYPSKEGNIFVVCLLCIHLF
jgi:hypothetical protein